jgi:DNA-binding Lrp family transcriptional regulator
LILACVLIRTERGRYDEVVDRIKQFNEVKNAFAVLGRYDVVADVETGNYESLSEIILRMGRIAGIVFTETLIEVKKG